ncbi:pro-sigmaK processing inhibitor BofA family protein [Texcoconibacillus texcoconensis]|uniref:Inhibitor of the pro-sigma K processing machinery n=1 Tax=Texcoconibacillus texcoconensis TaxID=1095777 RepID=A0A840QUH7_9BACI|nr:pro-sigmaK processing inhibitor BofA family protein [Texcoconibacillus texcoconensis]MBB5174931.1 inhibitor of the pro-sigma K processing machinery [Texcoconibacillus texcoconensis]
MEPIFILSLLAAAVFMLLIIGAPLKPLQWLGYGAIRLLVGALFLFFLNAFASPFDYELPINGVTAAVSGFLGVPGLAALVAIDIWFIP